MDSLLSEFILDDLGTDNGGGPTAPKSIKEQLTSSAPSFSTLANIAATTTITQAKTGAAAAGTGVGGPSSVDSLASSVASAAGLMVWIFGIFKNLNVEKFKK